MKTVAAIGAGNIFKTVHYPLFAKSCNVVAVVDIDAEKAKAAAQQYNIAAWYADARQMLQELRPDIVAVCVPNKFHCEMVMLALQHGCHVFCEKPPALQAQQAEQMMTLANEKGLVLAYNFHYRHSSNVALLKSQVEQNMFGRVYHAKVEAVRRRGVPGWGVFTNKELQGGGALIDLGVHMLDTALYLMGQPKVKSILATSYAEIGTRKNCGTLGRWDPAKFEVEDALFALLRFENGASLSLETAFALNTKEKSVMNVHIYGSEAGASVFPLEIYSDVHGELTNLTFPLLESGNNHESSVQHFLQRCNGEPSMLVDGAEGYYLQSILDGIYESSLSGAVVTL